MKKQKNRKKIFFKKFLLNPIFRVSLFVFVVGVIFFLIGQSIWQTKQFLVRSLEAEERGYTLKVQFKLSEMENEIVFFQEVLKSSEQNISIEEAERMEINENIRALSGRLVDIERYYLDRRFDYSLEFFGETSMTTGKKFEQLKKLTRDGELFLDDMVIISLSSKKDERAMGLAQYNFNVFEDNYFEALEMFY